MRRQVAKSEYEIKKMKEEKEKSDKLLKRKNEELANANKRFKTDSERTKPATTPRMTTALAPRTPLQRGMASGVGTASDAVKVRVRRLVDESVRAARWQGPSYRRCGPHHPPSALRVHTPHIQLACLCCRHASKR